MKHSRTQTCGKDNEIETEGMNVIYSFLGNSPASEF